MLQSPSLLVYLISGLGLSQTTYFKVVFMLVLIVSIILSLGFFVGGAYYYNEPVTLTEKLMSGFFFILGFFFMFASFIFTLAV
tara:strand:+ start:62 stop:310 length:249 start_codon:yes stop_codon:yes gene_type:complete